MSGKLQRFIPCRQIEAVPCHRTPNKIRPFLCVLAALRLGVENELTRNGATRQDGFQCWAINPAHVPG
jgi:hypothetical protein